MRRSSVRGLVAVVAFTALMSGGCGDIGGDDPRPSEAGGPTPTSPTTTETETEPETDVEPEPSPGPHPDADGRLPITIAAPTPFTNVIRRSGTLLTGSAKVSEGSLAWALLGSDLRPLVQGRMQATCGAPCTGRFRARVPTAKVQAGSYELHVWAPNAADEGPARLHDTLVPVTVVERATPGAPPADAFPPGGAPQ